MDFFCVESEGDENPVLEQSMLVRMSRQLQKNLTAEKVTQ